jgi:beta-mannosidase
MKKVRELSLNGDQWQVAEIGATAPPVAATVPGTIHTDLLAAGKIPDPFLACNETAVQWVGERDWRWEREVAVDAELLGRERIDLVFAGIDTVATVRLNGQVIAHSDNMYVPLRIDVTDQLRAHNRLEVAIDSPLRVGREREATHGLHLVECYGQPAPYVRKAPYSFAWDWGPKLPTSGIWQAVSLQAYETRLADVWPRTELSADRRRAKLTAQVEIVATRAHEALVTVELAGPGLTAAAELPVALPAGTSEHTLVLEVPDVELWWPHGYGSQPLYELTTRLVDRANPADAVDIKHNKIGFRTLELVRTPDGDGGGESFGFRVNGQDIFCRGANWIPDDNFLPRLSPEHYRRAVLRARDGGMNMLRVWGGGIYESETFYDLCDQLGVLVWQDFVFACSLYPDHLDWFRDSVAREAQANVRRLRGRTCLACFCGNNECHQAWHEWGWKTRGDWDRFYGQTLYDELLPQVVSDLAPHVPYWPGSPYAGDHPNSEHAGDMHCWAVWHCGEPAEFYEQLRCRFLSEFGFEAAPCAATLVEMAGQPIDAMRPQDEVIGHHERCQDGPAKLAKYLETEFGAPTDDLNLWIYRTQYVQAHCVGTALRHTRRRFPHCGGVLFWQHNDCWPAISWSCVDHVDRPKARRDFAATAYSIADHDGTLSVWLCGNRPEDLPAGEVRIKLLEFSGEPRFQTEVAVGGGQPGQQAYEAWRAAHSAVGLGDGRGTILVADYWADGQRLARATRTFAPVKDQPWRDPAITLTTEPAADGSFVVTLSAERVVLGAMLTANGDPSGFSDNFVTVLPGEPTRLHSRTDQDLIVMHAAVGLAGT